MNKITGEYPQPIIEDQPVDISRNPAILDLQEEAKRLTAEAREAMFLQALATSREQCNDLILTQNVRIAEQTQQVKNLEWSNKKLVNELKADVWLLSKEVKESNNQLSKSLNQTLGKISETVTDIERQVSTATAKATDEAVRVMKQSINKMADNAVIAVNESAGKMINEVNKAKGEIEKAKKEIRYESGFRKFMFWLSPVLAVAQTVLLIMLAL
jgi:uncharacterized protein YbjQ (UPF0145 family)